MAEKAAASGVRAVHAIVNCQSLDLVQSLRDRLGVEYAEDAGIGQQKKAFLGESDGGCMDCWQNATLHSPPRGAIGPPNRAGSSIADGESAQRLEDGLLDC